LIRSTRANGTRASTTFAARGWTSEKGGWGVEHRVVWESVGYFGGWPANNGAWIWDGTQILVGFTMGSFVEQSGHNIAKPYVSALARSMDGGETWALETPEPYVGRPPGLQVLGSPVDFTAPGFAMRVVGSGYHGSEEPRGGFFVSSDYGKHWKGAYGFDAGPRGPLHALPELEGRTLTPRTDYLVEGQHACRVFLSAREPGNWASEKVFMVLTADGGVTFDFAGWVVPRSDPYRAVMPATVRLSETRLVTAVRRRDMAKDDLQDDSTWIDTFVSADNGVRWAFQARVTEAGPGNGNPPALVRLADGRLCCVYGHRGRRQIEARFSQDGGARWSKPVVLRDDFQTDAYDTADLGYPRVVQRSDGALVAMYYWASRAIPRQHIAATIWA
jgi:hypothetical protein